MAVKALNACSLNISRVNMPEDFSGGMTIAEVRSASVLKLAGRF
jgi:hypothetical protein